MSWILLLSIFFNVHETPRVVYNTDTISKVQVNTNYNGNTSYWVFPKNDFPDEVTEEEYEIISLQLMNINQTTK